MLGFLRGGYCPPPFFNLFMADIPAPDKEKGQDLSTYADDVTLLASHEKLEIVEQNAQLYLDVIIQWLRDNNLILADKTQATVFSPDPAEYNYQLNLTIDGIRLETKKNPKILGLVFDPKLTYSEHITRTEAKAKSSLKLIKALTGTDWGSRRRPSLTHTNSVSVRCWSMRVPCGPR